MIDLSLMFYLFDIHFYFTKSKNPGSKIQGFRVVAVRAESSAAQGFG